MAMTLQAEQPRPLLSRFNTLSFKISMATILVVVAAAAAISFVWMMESKQALQVAYEKMQLGTAQQLAGFLEDKVRLRVEALSKTADRLDARRLGDDRYIEDFLANRPALQLLFPGGLLVVDPSGQRIVDYPPLPGRRDRPVGDRSYLREPMRTGQPFISEPIMGRGVQRAVLNMSVPIKDDTGRPRGVLVGVTPIGDNRFMGLVDELSKWGDAELYLVSLPDEHLIVASDARRVLSNLPPAGQGEVADRIRTNLAGSGRLKTSQGVEKLYGFARVSELNWALVVATTTANAFAPIERWEYQAVWFVLGGTLLAVLVMRTLVRRLTSRLTRAGRTLDAMTHSPGTLVPLQESGESEIRNLLGSFNRLIHSLHDRQAELILREAMYRAVVETSVDGFWMVDEQMRLVAVNDVYVKRSGYSREELLGMNVTDLDMTHDAKCARERHEAIFSKGADLFETTHRTKSGEIWPVEVSVTHQPNAWGGSFAFLRDITQRKQVERKLWEGEERLQLFIEHAPAALAMFDREMRYLSVSRRWRDDYGIGDREIIGNSHYEVFPEIGAGWKAIHRRALAGEAIRCDEDSFVRADQKVQWLRWEVLPWRVPGGEVGGIVIFSEDITARKNAETALRESESRLSRAQAAAKLGTWEWELLSNRIHWSDETFRLNGLEPGAVEASYETWLATVHPDDLPGATALIQDCMRRQVPFELEWRTANDSAPTRWLFSRAQPEFDMENRPIRYLGIVMDVTERKQAEAALIAGRAAEQANRAKSSFLAAASHDLRQPLQAVNLFTAALAASQLNDKQREIVDKISHSVGNLGDMLNQLLDLSKLDSGMLKAEPAALSPFDLLGMLDEEFAPLAAEKHLKLNLYCARQCPPLLVDHKLLAALLRNLVGNAVKYTEQGGILIAIRRRGDRALLQVWDTGIGIAPADQGKVFEEYFQANNRERDRAKGVGLGLAIVRRLAALLQTDVSCRSRPGRGSVFSFSLPLSLDPAMAGATRLPLPAAPEEPADRLARKRVVIVEDDKEVAEALKLAFSTHDLQTAVFNSAEEALACPQGRGADYYVSDYRLQGMDGVSFLDAIQKKTRGRLKAVLVSGETSPDRLARARIAGWPVLIKPIRFTELLSVLQGR